MNSSKVKKQHREKSEEIKAKIKEFRGLKDAGEERIFQELVFVILTSQTGAEKAWKAAEKLEDGDLLLEGSKEEIVEVLAQEDIQYEEDKARYIVENRNSLSQPTLQKPEKGLKLKEKLDRNPGKARKWLAENVKGLSWKGASHFLRNIGRGEDFAIISGHIAGKMHQLDLTEKPELPSGREEYLRYEKKLRKFSEETEIPLEELDLVLWSMETGEVFK
jgi:N-glycosylase/DNA lyase